NNPDPVFPQFGPYSPSFSPQAALQQTSTDPRVGLSNVTQSVLGVPAMVNDYLQSNRGASQVSAFNPAPASVTPTNPGGDYYLPKKGSSTPALTGNDITGGATFTGYKNFTGKNFNGFTQGPGYWGMTFFIW